MTNTNSEEEKILRRIPLEILILSFAVALASIFLFNPLTALFVLAGGAFSALSFTWLKTSISRLLLLEHEKKGDRHLKEKEPVPFFDKKKALRSALVLYGIRLVLIIAIFFIIIIFFSRNIIAFIAGFSAIVPVFLAEAIVALSRMKKWKN
jgi:hypothetical protein